MTNSPDALRPAAAAEVLAKLHAWFVEYDRLRTDEVESPILAEIRYALGDGPDPPALAAGDVERDALLATLAARDGHVTGQLPPVPAMLTVAGQRFVCECGANVFSKVGDEYRCNGCPRVYTDA